MEDKLDKVIELLQDIKKNIQDNQEEMSYTEKDGKVTFTFDINDRMVSVFPSLNNIMSALEDVSNYRRELYKYGVQNELYYNKKTKDVKLKEDMQFSEMLGEGYNTYIKMSEVIDKLDDILDRNIFYNK